MTMVVDGHTGVEHALPSCEAYHGEMGRKDFFGFAFDEGRVLVFMSFGLDAQKLVGLIGV